LSPRGEGWSRRRGRKEEEASGQLREVAIVWNRKKRGKCSLIEVVSNQVTTYGMQGLSLKYIPPILKDMFMILEF
jgi:hypothetical protein